MQLRSLLARHFPALDPARLPGGFDRVGDIAIFGITPEAMPHAPAIGALVLKHNPFLKVAARRDGDYAGEFRTRPLAVVAGEDRLTTVHRENGVVLHLDLARVYYSVRSAHERARIAALISPGERVCVLCSGVGPFPLVIARHSEAVEIIGIEKNPAAHGYALKNLRANRKLRGVRFLEGDGAEVLPNLEPGFDRILIVLPYGGEMLLPPALAALRPGGTLHFYDMQAKGCHSATLAKVETAAQNMGLHVQLIQVVTCGNCGPTVHRVCLDAVIMPAI
ncbi:MAG: class I SAM-dependent methyltransferase family protein [Desulfobulbus sp.]